MRHGHEMLWFLYEGLFLKVSSLLAIMHKFRMRARADASNWLRDRPFEQGITIYIYREILIISSGEKALGL